MNKQIQQKQFTETTDLQEFSWEDLLLQREKINLQLEQLEAAQKILSGEMLDRLNLEKISGKVVESWSISKATRISFDLSVEDARAYGAIKETVDQSVLKKLKNSGVEIPNEKRTEYVLVREVAKSE